MAMNDESKSILDRIMDISINDPEKFTNMQNLLPEIRRQITPFYSQAKILSLDSPNANNDVKNGELVHFRGAIQNDYHYAMHDSSIRVKLVDGRIVCMFPIFVNPTKIEKRLSPKVRPSSSHRIYSVMAIPGESKWVQLKEPEKEELVDEFSQMDIKNDTKEDKNLLLIRVYDEDDNEFKPNDIIEFYGIYYYFRELNNDSSEEENRLETKIDRSDSHLSLPTIHLIEHRILDRHELIERPLISKGNSMEIFNHLMEFSATLFDFVGGPNSFAISYFLSSLVAKTYQRTDEHAIPICTVPMAFLNIPDPRPFIHAAKLLLPMIQVVPMYPQILENERLFSRMNHETGILESGRLQLVPGTLLILDFTKYTTAAKMTKENFVAENIDALQRLINEQKLDIDYGAAVPKFHLPMDIPIVALCPGLNSYFLHFSTLVPLPMPKKNAQIDEENVQKLMKEMDEISPEFLQNFRWHLNNARNELDKIVLEKEEQKKIVETFTGIRERFGQAAVEHFRHLLSLTRIQTALGGHHEMKYELYKHLLEEENKRMDVLRGLNLA